jgi:anti-anti-sigma factor
MYDIRRSPRSRRRTEAPNAAPSDGGPTSEALGIQTWRWGNTWIITLTGRLEIDTRQALAGLLDDILEGDTHRTILDLSHLESIDPAGVSTILVAHLRSEDQHEDFLMVPGSRTVQAVIDRIDGPFSYVD